MKVVVKEVGKRPLASNYSTELMIEIIEECEHTTHFENDIFVLHSNTDDRWNISVHNKLIKGMAIFVKMIKDKLEDLNQEDIDLIIRKVE